MLPGETILSGAPDVCNDCNAKLNMEVLRSPAGYYIGSMCRCGPYSRETGYFKNKKQAEDALRLYDETGEMPGKRQ